MSAAAAIQKQKGAISGGGKSDSGEEEAVETCVDRVKVLEQNGRNDNARKAKSAQTKLAKKWRRLGGTFSRLVCDHQRGSLFPFAFILLHVLGAW